MEIKLTDISIYNILNAYKGKPGCMCGCNGKYYTAKQHQQLAGLKRGYKVDDEECDDKKVAQIYNKVKKAIEQGTCKEMDICESYCYVEIGKTCYALYFV